MVARLRCPTTLVGSGVWLILSGCPQLLTDDFQNGIHETSQMDSKLDASAWSSDPVPTSELDAGLGNTAGSDAGSASTDASQVTLTSTELALVPNLRAALAHRYDFDGIGITAVDTVAGADGYIYNDSLVDQGFIRLGANNQYVSLPDGLISSGPDRTLEAWLIWRGGDAWQRIFDFGSSDKGELQQGVGRSYLYLTAKADTGKLLVGFSLNGTANEVRLRGTQSLTVDQLTHVAVVVDGGSSAMSLYVDGALDSTVPLTQPLSGIVDNNLWIGHSQFVADPGLNADVLEFRIYNQALTPDELAVSAKLGADDPLTSTP